MKDFLPIYVDCKRNSDGIGSEIPTVFVNELPPCRRWGQWQSALRANMIGAFEVNEFIGIMGQPGWLECWSRFGICSVENAVCTMLDSMGEVYEFVLNCDEYSNKESLLEKIVVSAAQVCCLQFFYLGRQIDHTQNQLLTDP